MLTYRVIWLFLCIETYVFGSEYSSYQDVLISESTGIIQLQFPYNINTRYVTTTGTVNQTNNQAQLSPGTGSSASASLVSKARLNHQAGQGCSCIFGSRFTAGVSNNTQEVGIGNTQDGLFFGYNSGTFGVLYRRNSVNTWISQSSWNGDVMDGTGDSGVTLNPAVGNVYRIQYKGIGFGSVQFYIESPSDGSWILVHTIQYPNTSTNTLLLNSSLQLRAASQNIGTASANPQVFVASMSGMIDGKKAEQTAIRYSAANVSGKGITTSYRNVLAIRNNTTYTSKNNQVVVKPDMLSILQPDNSNPTEFTLFLNPTVGGTQSFANINATTSVVAFDTAGTTVTGGTNLGSFYIANDRVAAFSTGNTFLGTLTSAPELVKSEKYFFDIKSLDMILFPEDVLVVAAKTTTGSGTAYVSLSWEEQF